MGRKDIFMPRTGTFGGFAFDAEVFASYMAEQPTWSNAIIASGILQEDATLMDLIGNKGNVAVLPFYKALNIDDYAPYNCYKYNPRYFSFFLFRCIFTPFAQVYHKTFSFI